MVVLLVILGIAAAVVVVGSLAMVPFGAVTRARVQRFALRQSLPITVENGPVVLKYLATTRRWRGSGLLVSIIASVIWSAATGAGFSVGFTALFAGWFLGAIVAEWRVGQAVDQAADRRAALLIPRRVSSYLSWPILATLVVSAGGVIAVEVAAIVAARQDRPELVGLTLATVALAAIVAIVARHVLSRAQPLDEPGVLQADDALRSRSLHVLAGAEIATAGYLLSLTVTVASRNSDVWGVGALSTWTAIGIIVLPVLGLLVATAPTRRRRSKVGAVA